VDPGGDGGGGLTATELPCGSCGTELPPNSKFCNECGAPLTAHPRFVVHFTPTSASWLNLVERWFSELTTKKLRRGTHTSVRQLNADIRAWINTWNDNPRPYVWTKTADQILASIGNYCNRINDSRH
jgi:hypothetical protein